MERIILKHRSGSKANQVEEFPLKQFKELMIGRDPAATVQYHPDFDDLVGRRHARIERDLTDPTQFLITDLKSRNGTYVNNARINETAKLKPGDIVQLGPGGPAFEFDLEPRPESFLRPTREAADMRTVPLGDYEVPTTQTDAMSASPTEPVTASSAPAGAPRPSVGRATVERMITMSQSKSRKNLILGGVVVVALLVLVVGVLIYQNRKTEQGLAEITQREEAREQERKAILDPKQIAEKYSPSVVFIRVSWKLTENGSQVYHKYRAGRPLYLPRGPSESRLEPMLTLDPRGNVPLGYAVGGSGFVVKEDGFILTNRHVAAPWFAPYPNLPRGIVVTRDRNGEEQIREVEGPTDWIPAQALRSNRSFLRLLEAKSNDDLEVTFPQDKLSTRGQVERISDEHDVALLKINLPQALPKVELRNEGEIKPGEAITVIGYPLTGAPVFTLVRDKTGLLGPGDKVAFVPQPAVTAGVIKRVIKAGSDSTSYYSSMGDNYEHDAKVTPGNSGAPVFDQQGDVIGLVYAGFTSGQITNYAVPIQYGKGLMGPQAVRQ
jgi:serine protease Do